MRGILEEASKKLGEHGFRIEKLSVESEPFFLRFLDLLREKGLLVDLEEVI